MTKDLDALPLLPQKPGQARFMTIATTSFHSSENAGHWYSPDAVREIVAAELRKAQEGREPVFWYRVRSDGRYEGPIPNSSIEEVRKKSGAWTPLYAVSPPPKSDEARDAERYRWLRSDDVEIQPGQREICVVMNRLPFREDQRDEVLTESALDAAIDAALAAQQKVKK